MLRKEKFIVIGVLDNMKECSENFAAIYRHNESWTIIRCFNLPDTHNRA